MENLNTAYMREIREHVDVWLLIFATCYLTEECENGISLVWVEIPARSPRLFHQLECTIEFFCTDDGREKFLPHGCSSLANQAKLQCRDVSDESALVGVR